jgi:hypothetical protein
VVDESLHLLFLSYTGGKLTRRIRAATVEDIEGVIRIR